MTDGSLDCETQCPRCDSKLRIPQFCPGLCRECGAAIWCDEDGRAYDAAAYPATIVAADVPGLLAAELERRRATRRSRLLEVHALNLPFWLDRDGGLTAAFPSAMDAIEKVRAPAVKPRPTRLETLPTVSAKHAAPGAVRLVLLPVFDVTYEIRGRTFHAVVDGTSGVVHADCWPHPWKVGIHVAMAAVLVFDLLLFAVAGYLAPDNPTRAVAVVALMVPVYALNRLVAERLGDRWRR